MTIQTTSRAGLRYPQGSDAAVVHADIQHLAEDASSTFAMYLAGTRAARPSTNYKDGRIYRQTDDAAGYPIGTLWFDNGVGWSLLFDPNGTHGTPTGVMVDFAGTVGQVPVGWVACDGSAVTAAANPLLRQFLIDAGSPYGTSGSDPRTPDLRGRIGVGLDDLGTAAGDAGRLDLANTIGLSGGVQYHQLVTGEMPAHAHPVTVSSGSTGITASSAPAGAHTHGMSGAASSTHTHSYSGSASVSSTGVAVQSTGAGTQWGTLAYAGTYGGSSWGTTAGPSAGAGASDSAGAHSHTINITDPQHAHTASSSNTGGGGGHNNMQPYLLVRKIIKA